MTGKRLQIISLLALWAFLVLLVVSQDSPLHFPCSRTDSAWFFMSGKAWMNGMKPYVDFTDSKGPLLWLLYGIGYLISPRSYLGVYIISSLVYAAIFYYNYKTAKIFQHDDRKAFLVTLLMAAAYFGPWYHVEVRAEDFSTLPVAISLYWLCKMLYGEEDEARWRQAFFVMGSCFSALVLIKFSTAVMLGVILLIAIGHQAVKRQRLVVSTFWTVFGAVAFSLPFIVYLAAIGSLRPFIAEYFFNTLGTVSSSASWTDRMLREMSWTMADYRNLLFLLVITLGSVLLGIQQKHYRWVPVFISMAFFALSSLHNIWGYYYGMCSIFLLFLLTAGMQWTRWSAKGLATAMVMVIVAETAAGVYANFHKRLLCDSFIANKSADCHHYEHIDTLLCDLEKPRILDLYCYEHGMGLRQEALPAGKYWAHQTGMLPDMEKEHLRLLFERKADFIVWQKNRTKDKRITDAGIQALGYQKIYECYYKYRHLTLYRKKPENSR